MHGPYNGNIKMLGREVGRFFLKKKKKKRKKTLDILRSGRKL